MLIDWFTVAAQAVNFLLLVWLMQRFLYKPILLAIAQREQLIAGKLAEADAKKLAAEQSYAEFTEKNKVFDQQRADLLKQASDAAETERLSLLAQAKQEAEALTLKRQQLLENEIQQSKQTLSDKVSLAVLNISRKTLNDFANSNLETSMLAVFNLRLANMADDSRQAFIEAWHAMTEPVEIVSSFPLSTGQCASLQNAVNVCFSADIPLRYQISPDLIAGITMRAGGWKLAWNIADYLDELAEQMALVNKANV